MVVARSSIWGSISYKGPTGVFMLVPTRLALWGLRNQATVWSEAIDGRRTSTQQKQRQVAKENSKALYRNSHSCRVIPGTNLKNRTFHPQISDEIPWKPAHKDFDHWRTHLLDVAGLVKPPAYQSVSNDRFEFYTAFAFKTCQWIHGSCPTSWLNIPKS